MEAAIVEQALALLLTAGALGREGIGNESLVFLPHLIRAEKEIAERIGRLATSAAAYPAIDFAAALAWCEQRTGKALEQILRNR